LLYRHNADDEEARIDSGDQASAEVILKAFLEIGLANVSPEQPVFINHTEGLVAMDPIVPPDRCVIEVLEGVPVNRETIGDLQRLRGMGYRIALDDFVYSGAIAPFLLRSVSRLLPAQARGPARPAYPGPISFRHCRCFPNVWTRSNRRRRSRPLFRAMPR